MGDGSDTEDISAFLAWRGAARSAHKVLLEASRIAIAGDSLGRKQARDTINSLCRLEAEIDRHLAALAAPPPRVPPALPMALRES